MTNFPFAGKIHGGRRTINKSEADDLNLSQADAGYTAHNFVSMDGRLTVTELLAYLEERVPGVALEDIGITWFSLVWVDEVTAKERADHDRRAARRTQNRIDWERKTLAELLEKCPQAQAATNSSDV